jgi:hypothetical protein
MDLAGYLAPIASLTRREKQKSWFLELEERVKAALELYGALDERARQCVWDELRNRIRTEEVKAWYCEPEQGSLFQGTSISSLTVPHTIPEPLALQSITELEEEIAGAYINLHHRHVDRMKGAFQEAVDEWLQQGLYYGVVICSKVISQAFGLSIYSEEAIFEVDGHHVDPHEITSYPSQVREAYFEECKRKIACFDGLDLEQRELESSLVLADISKPKIARYKDQVLLAPIRCNEIAALLSERIVRRITEKSSGEIVPKGLTVVIYDTDTPYTYHEIMGYCANNLSPALPGLTILGSSGTIDAFRWLYTYRVSLISQKIQKGSVYSVVQGKFTPFVFYGVLVWRDAEILLDMENLSMLRYRGNLSPDLEFAYLVADLCKQDQEGVASLTWQRFRELHFNQ